MNWLKLERVETPENPVSLSLAKKHLREDLDDQDDLIELYIRAAADTIEGPDGAGIALNSQQWDLWLDCFPTQIALPIGPLIQVDSITYTDTDGVEQTFLAADYEVDTLKGRVRPVDGKSWPTTDTVYNAVKVRFTAGYTTLPGDLQAAVLLITGHLYEHRVPVIVGESVAEVPFSAQVIIDRHRRGRFA